MRYVCTECQTASAVAESYGARYTFGYLNASMSVQFKMVSMCREKPIYALPRLPDVSPTLPLKQFQCLIDDGPLSSFEGRSSNAFSFHASLLQAIDGVISVALRPQVMSQAPQYFRSSEKHPTCESCFPAIVSARSFPFTPACLGQYIHRSFRRWMSTSDTIQSGLPIPLFSFCSKLIESCQSVDMTFFLCFFAYFGGGGYGWGRVLVLNCSGRSVVGRSFLQPLSEKRRKKKNVIGVGFRKT